MKYGLQGDSIKMKLYIWFLVNKEKIELYKNLDFFLNLEFFFGV